MPREILKAEYKKLTVVINVKIENCQNIHILVRKRSKSTSGRVNHYKNDPKNIKYKIKLIFE